MLLMTGLQRHDERQAAPSSTAQPGHTLSTHQQPIK